MSGTDCSGGGRASLTQLRARSSTSRGGTRLVSGRFPVYASMGVKEGQHARAHSRA
jgi:hypothetical protein